MSVITTVNTECDKCGLLEIVKGGSYHPTNWLWIKIEMFMNDGYYNQKNRREREGNYCPSCTKVYGEDKLIAECPKKERK